MAFLAFDNYGTVNGTFQGQVRSFYDEAGLINLAFVTSATYAALYGAGNRTGWFSVNTGSFTPEVTYYASGGVEFTPSAGSSMMGVYINRPDDNGITGIGSYHAGNGTRCFYEGALGAGEHTPVLTGYDFTPSSETATQAVGVLTFTGTVSGGDPPDKATNPNPANTATGITLDQPTLTWTEGDGADYEEVYFGPSGNMSLVDANDTDQSFSLAGHLPLSYNTTYQWRIDSANDDGTTAGDTWSFTTLIFGPPSGGGGPGSDDFQIIKRLCACAENRFWYEDV
jgi:hypothetical protein